ncbi:Outer membrane porin F precursor [Shimia sp. SK013]|nr:Outer membrane porin F precursor [Shimia sp. SK013]
MRFGTVVIALCAAIGLATPGFAQVVKSQSIIQQLTPQNTGPQVRSMSPIAKRGIDIQGQLPTEIDLPSVSLTVNFELGSAYLTTDGMLALRSLAKALHDPTLTGMTFQIAGHTDGRGDHAFNMKLSDARARTVVEHLTTIYDVPVGQLIPIGYGMSRPMDPANLMNPLNRRVEIINLEPLS